jgi:hypothetical protein
LSLLSQVRLLKLRDVELFHAEHGLHGPLGFGRGVVGDEFQEKAGDDLPGEAEFVFQPTALLGVFVAAGGEFVSEVVHFRLCLALDLKRDGFVEFEDRTTVDGGEGLAIQFERHAQDRPSRFAVDFLADFGVASDLRDLGILENGGVEPGDFLGLMVEPKARDNGVDGGHGWLLASLKKEGEVLSLLPSGRVGRTKINRHPGGSSYLQKARLLSADFSRWQT